MVRVRVRVRVRVTTGFRLQITVRVDGGIHIL